MNAVQFLKLLWPAQGLYCLATPFTPKGSTKAVFAHKVFTTIEAAAAAAERRKLTDNMFFCIHTLKKDRVWNAKKKDLRTGQLGAYEVRTQSNTLAAKAFFFDLDVGVSEPDKPPKFETREEALTALKDFCGATLLPKPLIVSSGGGFHVYWIMHDDLLTEFWKPIAHKLKKLAQHHGLKLDPSRTTDNASVLRVAGTFNLKKSGQPREVKTLTPPCIMTAPAFEKLIDNALIRANVPLTTPTTVTSLPASSDFNNIGAKTFDGPPVDIKSLLGACGQLLRVAKLGGRVSEPEWYAALSSVRLVENGQKYIHKISEKHPDYDPAATDAKAQQLEDKGIGPTGCDKWHDLHPSVCEKCPLYGSVKSPLAAARKRPASLPAPLVSAYSASGVPIQVEMTPAEPFGFQRAKEGLMIHTTNKKGDAIDVKFYDHDFYPVRRVVNSQMETEDQVWRVHLPRVKPHEFIVPSPALYDHRKLAVVLANNGIYPKVENFPHMQEYMVAYISKLQALVDAESQHNHLGWTDDHTKFIMPDRVMLPDGSSKQVSLSRGAQISTKFVKRKGTIEDQVALLNFYSHKNYLPHQFYILCGLAAPLFYMTGHHGVIVNATGDPGASKSSALYTAASFWGQTEQYAINGTNNGATMKGRNERISTLANLPICVDEITNMKPEDAIDMAMSITQPGHRIRLKQDGTEQAGSEGYKATIMMCTANSSLHTVLSTKNVGGTAGSMRVFEIMFRKTSVHKKHEADDYLQELRQNYGWIGERFMEAVIINRPAIEKRVRAVMKRVDLAANITSGERFWSALVAVALVAGEIATRLGLLPFVVQDIEQWVLQTQIPHMRGVVRDEYSSPVAILADYMGKINSQVLVIQSTQVRNGQTISLAAQMPHGALLARQEQDTKLMYINKADFKKHCVSIGANDRQILEDLYVPRLDANGVSRRIVVNRHARKVLGSGTDLEKMQAYVFTVDMSHPEVASRDPLGQSAKPSAKDVLMTPHPKEVF
jgi:hypothetical protein